MHRDPTFDFVYHLECREIKNNAGCSGCIHRGEHLAWDKYQCKINQQINQYGYCKSWQLREDK